MKRFIFSILVCVSLFSIVRSAEAYMQLLNAGWMTYPNGNRCYIQAFSALPQPGAICNKQCTNAWGYPIGNFNYYSPYGVCN
jgi:hypothetical protein